MTVVLEHPLALLLIPLVVVMCVLLKRMRGAPSIAFSSGTLLRSAPATPKVKMARGVFLLRALCLALFALALARPQGVSEEKETISEGIDIVLAVDVSSSMRAEDPSDGRRVNRLVSAKEVLSDFIRRRTADRIGMVVFASHAYLASPLTLDHEWLQGALDRVEIHPSDNSTAIGSGLLSSLRRLRDSQARNRIVVLLTDGRNNAGDISPHRAADAARALGVRVYTIGVGSERNVLYPEQGPFGTTIYRTVALDVDEEILRMIAARSGGRYFRAEDASSLEVVCREIDLLEKSELREKVFHRREELFPFFIVTGLGILLLEVTARNTLLRRIP